MFAQQLIRTYYVPDWNAIGAIATAAAVIVALAWEPFRKWYSQPRLKVTWRGRDAEAIKLDEFGATALNVRLFVTNNGRTAAQRIELTLADVYRRQPDGKLRLLSGFLPSALIWTHTESPRWEYLPPKSSRLCNLGSLHDIPALPAPINRPAEMFFDLDTEVRPASRYNILPPGSYVIRIVGTAINCGTADVFEVGINVGAHRMNGEELNFSFFDAELVQSVRRSTRS